MPISSKGALTTLALTALLGGLGTASQAQTELTNRSQITGGTVIDWNQFAGNPSLSNPFTATANDGTPVTVSQSGGSSARFLKLNQGTSSFGNFAPGDGVLYNGRQTNGVGGPITLTFTSGISSIGTQIEETFYGSFTAQVQTFDQFGNVLATFTEAGVSNGNNDNSAIFLGVADPTADIYHVTYSVTASQNGSLNDIEINKVSFNGAPVPEASTTVSLGLLLFLGMGGVVIAARRKKQAV